MRRISVHWIVAAVALASFLGFVCPLTFKEKVQRLKIDLNYVSEHARSIVDIVFVLDASGSIADSEFQQSKTFVKDFLEYFSIAPGHGQVGVVLYASLARTAIPLRVDSDKCQFMTDLSNLNRHRPYIGGSTNTTGGLKQAWNVLRAGSRYRTSNSLRLVVLVTDGAWTVGGDPISVVSKMKADMASDGGIRLMVVAVGVDPYYTPQMENWSSPVMGNPMHISVSDHHMLAQLAYAIHNGTHHSKYTDVNSAECRSVGKTCGLTATSLSQCMCDSFGTTGEPHCGCEKGGFVMRNGGRFQCQTCARGMYQDSRNIKTTCKKCPDMQTTSVSGSTSGSDCICKKGFWDPIRKTRQPARNQECQAITCRRDTAMELDRRNIDVVGVCTYTYGQKCRYACRSGHFFGGDLVRTCMDNGKMDQALPTCSVLSCPSLHVDPNSQGWTCEYQGRPRNPPFIYGTQCMSSCNSGHLPAPNTEAVVECVSDPQNRNKVHWSSHSLQCVAKQCPPLPDIANGYYDYTYCSDSSLQRTFGVRCKAQCKRGYSLTERVEWTCDHGGVWTNNSKVASCEDTQPPSFVNCPKDQQYTNLEHEGYYMWKIPLATVKDNGPDSLIEQHVTIKQPGHEQQIKNCMTDCDDGIAYIGGRTEVTHTAVDQAGNKAICRYYIEVEDVEKPTSGQCDGPVTNNGTIETPDQFATVSWPPPEFNDNSGLPLDISSNWISGGRYSVNRTYDVVYTATDKAGNSASCTFSFKVVNKKENCAQLHTPANGYMTCDSLAFGYFCAPSCDEDHVRQADDVNHRLAHDYFCDKGKWKPDNVVGDCRRQVYQGVPTEIVFRDYCEDSLSKKQIITQLITEIDSNPLRFRARIFKDSLTPEQLDQFHVFCGPKNRTIVAFPGTP